MTNLYHYIARASADTNAGLKLETQIRLSNMVFWITDSQLKGQLDMSTDARIYHDTMPMYRPAANPRGEAPCRSCNPLGRSHVTQRRLASFAVSFAFLDSASKRSPHRCSSQLLPTFSKTSEKRNNAAIHPARAPDSGSGFGRATHFTLVWGKWLSLGPGPGHSIPLTYWYTAFLPCALRPLILL